MQTTIGVAHRTFLDAEGKGKELQQNYEKPRRERQVLQVPVPTLRNWIGFLPVRLPLNHVMLWTVPQGQW